MQCLSDWPTDLAEGLCTLLKGVKDWELFSIILDEHGTFVTGNSVDLTGC